MVYSIRTNQPFETKAPLKTSRQETEWSKQTKQFILAHNIAFHMSADGVPSVKVEKKNG